MSKPEHDELRRQITDLLAKGLIEPSSSPFAAPVLFVQKKSGELRMCIDYRQLNKITIRDQYPLPRIDDLFDQLAGKTVFSSLDLQAGYHQIRIPAEDVPKTAFRTPEGHYQFKVLCFGLTNAPATFQRVMNEAFAEVINDCALVYLDDILVMSENTEEHLVHLRRVFDLLRKNKFYAKLSKCAANYVRKFVHNFSTIAAPLTNLTGPKKDSFPWKAWPQTELDAFNALKQAIANVPMLKLPDHSKPFQVHCDASLEGIGAVLMLDGYPLAYYSRKLIPAEVNYTTGEQELLALWLVRAYAADSNFTKRRKTKNYYLDDNGLWRHNKRRTVIVPRDKQLREHILHEMHDAKKSSDSVFQVGDRVLLSTMNLRNMVGKARKLLPRYVGPFRIEAHVGEDAVKLTLPPAMSRIHPVFHVSLLRPYEGNFGRLPPTELGWLDDSPQYEVERIVNHRHVRAGKAKEYLQQQDQKQEQQQSQEQQQGQEQQQEQEEQQQQQHVVQVALQVQVAAGVVAAKAALPPGGGMFWQQGPDGYKRPKSIDNNVLRKAIVRMKSFFHHRVEREATCLTPDLGMDVMQGKKYVTGILASGRLTARKVFFIPMGGRLIAVYPKHDLFVVFCPRGQGLSEEEESNLCVFLNAHVKQTKWEVIDGTCPLQKDDWSDELRLLIHMEYLWRRSISEVPSPVPSPPMSIVSPESPPSPSPPSFHDPGHTPPQSSELDNGTESQPSPGPLPLPSAAPDPAAPASAAPAPADPATATAPAPATAAPDPAQADPATAYSVLHAVDVNRLINTVRHLDERQNREVAYGQAAWHAVSQLQKAVGDAMLELHQRQRAAFQQQQQELERQLRQQNDTVLMLQQQLQASEKARAQMQKQMLQQEQQVKKQMEQLTASVASLLEEAGKPAAPATTTSKGQKRGRRGKQVDNSEEATVWRPCNYADGNVVVKKFTPEQADQWREAVLEMGVAMTSLPGHLIPTSQLEWALQLLSLVFGYAIFNDIPLTESYGWPVISKGDLDVRYSTGQRLQMPFTTANADGSLPDDVSMSGCWTARSLRIIRKDQAMAAQQDAEGEAARTRLKQYATAVRLARPYLRKLQQHASQLSQVTLRGGTVLTNDTMHGRDVNSVGMALTKATGLVAAQALHVDVNPDPSLSTPPHTAAAAAAATAPQTSSPPSHAVPSTSAPAASSATTPTAPPRFIWGRDGLVMIIAVGVTQVLVSPGSHVQVLKVEKKHKGEISARVLKTAMKAMPKMQVYRVTLQPGEVLGMRGYTVHAGDWGLPDKASTRVHLYGSEGYINNATCFLSMLDVEFVHKCQPTSPPQRREQYDNWPPGLGPLHGGLYVQPEPYERPARAPVDTLWNSDWALSDELVQAELTSLLGHWDESMAAEAVEEAEKEKKKGKKVVVAEVTEEAQETEEAGGKEAGDEEARKKKQHSG
ncbi:hypothetical protein QJQ45_002318 [Haematococcus lacustris]|nr:hypothetical protein QJQ45_002318 [Haematococcus lacustris]